MHGVVLKINGVVLKINGPILSIADVPQLLQNRLSVNKLCFRKERDTNLLKKICKNITL